ncbi:MAG: hypothetical protein ACKVS5_16090 [Parvularculaceae bacterium]
MKSALHALFALFAVSTLAATSEALAAEKVHGVEISPGGRHYAVLRDAGDQRAFAIYAVDETAAAPKGVGLGTIDIEDFEWGGDDYLLLRVAGEKGGLDTTAGLKTINFSRWMSIARETGKSQTLFGNERGSDFYYFIGAAGELLHALPLDNENALFARASIEVKPGGPSRLKEGVDEQLYSLQRANLKTGKAVILREGTPDTIDWIVDEAGAVIARIDQAAQSKKIAIMATDASGRNAKAAGEISGDAVEQERPAFFGAVKDARALQILKQQVGGFGGLAMYSYSLEAPGFGPAIDAPAPFQRAVYDPRFGRARIAYYASAGGERAYHFEADDQKAQASLEKALTGASVAIVSRSVDGARMIARAAYADKGEEYYFFDKAAKRLELVATN